MTAGRIEHLALFPGGHRPPLQKACLTCGYADRVEEQQVAGLGPTLGAGRRCGTGGRVPFRARRQMVPRVSGGSRNGWLLLTDTSRARPPSGRWRLPEDRFGLRELNSSATGMPSWLHSARLAGSGDGGIAGYHGGFVVRGCFPILLPKPAEDCTAVIDRRYSGLTRSFPPRLARRRSFPCAGGR